MGDTGDKATKATMSQALAHLRNAVIVLDFVVDAVEPVL